MIDLGMELLVAAFVGFSRDATLSLGKRQRVARLVDVRCTDRILAVHFGMILLVAAFACFREDATLRLSARDWRDRLLDVRC